MSNGRRRGTVGTLAATAIAVSLGSPAAVPARADGPPPPSGSTGFFQAFVPLNQALDRTDVLKKDPTEATRLAGYTNLVVDNGGSLNDSLSVMRAVNPHLRVMEYFDPTFADSPDQVDPSLLAHDQNGNTVHAKGRFGNYVLDPSQIDALA